MISNTCPKENFEMKSKKKRKRSFIIYINATNDVVNSILGENKNKKECKLNAREE